MRSPRRRRWTALLSFLCFAPVIAAADQRAGTEIDRPSYSFPRDAQTVVIQYDRVPGEFTGHDSTPLLRVYGDGTVLVHVPSWRRDAGAYRLKLRDAELHELVRSLVADGVPTFDAKAARRRIVDEHRLRTDARIVHDISDPELTVMSVAIDVAQTDDGAARTRAAGETHVVRWPNLQDDARRHPGVDEVARLAAAELRLLDLTRRADLVPVE